ncbi:hypothetical protein H9643_19755 [Ochrobactrum sp. Sa2BUA5]|jgi:hypothetical protein|nr:hypothetical protein [Ochrobactrum gallinarum]
MGSKENLHDAEIIGVFHDKEKRILSIHCRNTDRSNFVVRFMGCIYFKIEDFSHQNIVSRLNVLDRSSPEDHIESIMNWITTLDGAGIASKFIISSVNRVLMGELKIAYFEPTWGAEIGVVFEVIEFQK